MRMRERKPGKEGEIEMDMECLICGKGKLKPATIEEKMYGIGLGSYRGEQCDNPDCRETFLAPEEMKRLEACTKELGLWGLGESVKIGKLGNSLIVRIPTRLAHFLNLEQGRTVSIMPDEKDKMILELR